MNSFAQFAFTKISVDDLEREAGFYKSALGLIETARIKLGGGDDQIEEIILSTSGHEDSQIILCCDPRSRTNLPAGETTIGFSVVDLDNIVHLAVEQGGSIVQPTMKVPDADVAVALIADPEGHLLELIQNLGEQRTP